MIARIKNNRLLISVPLLAEPKPSKSGKTLLIANTHGNRTLTADIFGQERRIVVNVAAYYKNRKQAGE